MTGWSIWYQSCTYSAAQYSGYWHARSVCSGSLCAENCAKSGRYVGEKYTTTGSYIRTGMLTLVVPAPTRPIAPVATSTPPVVDPVNQEIFKEKIWMYVEIKSSIETTMKLLYNLIWGQCSETLRSRLHGNGDYNKYLVSAYSIALLKGIRAKMTG
jgi:hypothetical protein